MGRFKVACDKDFTIIMKGARVPEGDIVPEKFDNQRCKLEEYNNIRRCYRFKQPVGSCGMHMEIKNDELVVSKKFYIRKSIQLGGTKRIFEKNEVSGDVDTDAIAGEMFWGSSFNFEIFTDEN